MPFRDARAAEVVREVMRRAKPYQLKGIITSATYTTAVDADYKGSKKPAPSWAEARLVVLGETFIVRSYVQRDQGSLLVSVMDDDTRVTLHRDGRRVEYKVEWGDLEYDTVQTAASYILLVLRGCYPSWVKHQARGFADSCNNCPNQMMCLTDDARA